MQVIAAIGGLSSVLGSATAAPVWLAFFPPVSSGSWVRGRSRPAALQEAA